MGFKEAVRTVLKQKYVTFSGRASRSEYWWFQLFFWLVFVSCGAMVGILTVKQPHGQGFSWPTIVVMTLTVIAILGLFLPQTAAVVRRFHDRNLSGWWYLALIIGGMIPYVKLFTWILTIVILALPGTKGPNKFGSDPLNPSATAEVFA